MSRALPLKILAFDVFGTVVDWCQSVADEVSQLNLNVNGLDFARAWRAGYRPAMDRVRSGELPWMPLDDLHRLTLDNTLTEFGVTGLDENQKNQLNEVWHRLKPWPDAVLGIQQLKSQYIVTTLSNGNIRLLTNMAKFAGLPWDCILSAEIYKAYKPDPATYLGVANTFALQPEQVMLVAAHQDDLNAAHQCGLKTAYIERPYEFGPDQIKATPHHTNNTYHAKDFLDLARQLNLSHDSSKIGRQKQDEKPR